MTRSKMPTGRWDILGGPPTISRNLVGTDVLFSVWDQHQHVVCDLRVHMLKITRPAGSQSRSYLFDGYVLIDRKKLRVSGVYRSAHQTQKGTIVRV